VNGLGGVALAHLVRIVVVLLLIGAAGRFELARSHRGDGVMGDVTTARAEAWRRAVQIRFAVAGGVLAVTWLWRGSTPIWQHALRLAVVLFVVAPTVSWLRRRSRDGHETTPLRRDVSRVVLVAKFLAILAASVLQWLLQKWISPEWAATVVGLALGLAVAVGGPEVVRLRLRRERQGQQGARGNGLP